ncbi:MAG: low molecular weight protein-tyrosine-phosphatase [Trueperaceae bacterium]|nr:low molecular weight protein-tyrosine-phosphatase [Trueperaceae bacterium]
MSEPRDKIGVLFVCMGNICRSPTAEGVFRDKLDRAGLADRVEVDSAGTGDWHVGQAPDSRAQEAAKRRGIDLSDIRGRQVEPSDLSRFDYLLAMDGGNLWSLQALAHGARGRAGAEDGDPPRIQKLLEFAPDAPRSDVPDPYAGGERGFEEVLDLIDAATDGLLEEVRGRLS